MIDEVIYIVYELNKTFHEALQGFNLRSALPLTFKQLKVLFGLDFDVLQESVCIFDD